MMRSQLVLRGTLLLLAGCGGTTATPDASITPDVLMSGDVPSVDVVAVDTADAGTADRTVSPDISSDISSDIPPDMVRDVLSDTGSADAAADASTPDVTPPDAGTDAMADVVPTDAMPDVVTTDAVPIDPTAARLISPLSNAVVTSHRPRLRWRLARGDGAHVQLCRDPACADVVSAFDATGSDAQPATALSPGVYFWRIYERTGAARATTPSTAWHFRVDARDTAVDSASRWASDYNNDGYQDITLNLGTFSAQRALVFLGRAGGPAAAPDQRLAVWLYPLGDHNGDGFDEALADGAVRLGSATGVSPSVLGTPPAMGPTTAYVALDDVNRDGYTDLLVSGGGFARERASFEVYAGGASSIASTPLVSVSEDFFAFSSSTFEAYLGDVNGDGTGDVGVSVSAIGGVSFSTGFLSLTPTWRQFGRGQCNTERGSTTYGAGDVNGDGYADLVASCGGAHDDLYPPRHSVVPGGMTDAPATGASYGAAGLTRLGDVNGDGCADLLVQEAMIVGGASTTLPRGTIQHGVCGATIATTVQRTVDLTNVEYRAVGDVNRDGYDDVLIVTSDRSSARFLPGSATGLVASPTATLSLAP